ncbi:hypothetical protein RPPS3_10550 [Rhodopseudomonas palustris]|nr:hypothetical protein RPPS3_10550 [Rhodopseudomonas palustris]
MRGVSTLSPQRQRNLSRLRERSTREARRVRALLSARGKLTAREALTPALSRKRERERALLVERRDPAANYYFAGVIRTCTSRGFAVYGADVTSTSAPASA